jgi:hypothetical protein
MFALVAADGEVSWPTELSANALRAERGVLACGARCFLLPRLGGTGPYQSVC